MNMSNYKNMSSKEHEFWIPFLLARDGYRCVLCNSTLTELIKKSKPNRKLPLLVIEHIDGDSRFTDSVDGELRENLRLTCYPCNKKVEPEQLRITSHRKEMSASHSKHDQAEPIFLNYITKCLINDKHLCYERMIHSGAKVALRSSPVTTTRYFKTNFEGKYEIFKIADKNIICDYQFCNGEHICFIGEIPRSNPMPKPKLENENEIRDESTRSV